MLKLVSVRHSDFPLVTSKEELLTQKLAGFFSEVGNAHFETPHLYVSTVKSFLMSLSIEELPASLQQVWNGEPFCEGESYRRVEILKDPNQGLTLVGFVFKNESGPFQTKIHDHHTLSAEHKNAGRTLSVSICHSLEGDIQVTERIFSPPAEGSNQVKALAFKVRTVGDDSIDAEGHRSGFIHSLHITPNGPSSGKAMLLHLYSTPDAINPNRKCDYVESST